MPIDTTFKLPPAWDPRQLQRFVVTTFRALVEHLPADCAMVACAYASPYRPSRAARRWAEAIDNLAHFHNGPEDAETAASEDASLDEEGCQSQIQQLTKALDSGCGNLLLYGPSRGVAKPRLLRRAIKRCDKRWTVFTVDQNTAGRVYRLWDQEAYCVLFQMAACYAPSIVLLCDVEELAAGPHLGAVTDMLAQEPRSVVCAMTTSYPRTLPNSLLGHVRGGLLVKPRDTLRLPRLPVAAVVMGAVDAVEASLDQGVSLELQGLRAAMRSLRAAEAALRGQEERLRDLLVSREMREIRQWQQERLNGDPPEAGAVFFANYPAPFFRAEP
eukprot:TRINITY_DN17023_c0_g1_i1.p1 TRINITY_DN17023_c0_g1~~TRINITY_DN17023_c0_g1_i1.p1  ORF type:complete len:366 (+),score=77.55 TRINITY_DN17023_c0_g1_i1:112-1098(+)